MSLVLLKVSNFGPVYSSLPDLANVQHSRLFFFSPAHLVSHSFYWIFSALLLAIEVHASEDDFRDLFGTV